MLCIYIQTKALVFFNKNLRPPPPKGPGSYKNDYEAMGMIDEQRLYINAM